MSGTGKSLKFVKATGNSVVDSLLTGDAWVGTITYAFPTWRGGYGYGFEKYYGFTSISAAQAKTALFAMEQSYGSAANDGFSVEDSPMPASRREAPAPRRSGSRNRGCRTPPMLTCRRSMPPAATSGSARPMPARRTTTASRSRAITHGTRSCTSSATHWA